MKYNDEILNINNIIKNKKSGKHMLGMLQNLYCSCQSEFSAFLLFNYQNCVLLSTNKKLSSLLKEFSQISLQNSHKLAQIILSQKGLPVYLNSQQSPLSAFWLQYDCDPQKVLQMDISFLKTLIQNYDIYISKIKNKKITNALHMLKQNNEILFSKLNNFKLS